MSIVISSSEEDQLVFNLADMQRLLRVGKTKVQELTYSGELPSIKIGTRRVWHAAGVRAWLAAQAVDKFPAGKAG